VIERPDEGRGASTEPRATAHVASVDHDKGLDLSAVGFSSIQRG